MKLIAGLGNPGRRYEMTRHNIGHLAVDQLPFFDDLPLREKFDGLFAAYDRDGEKIFVLKPCAL